MPSYTRKSNSRDVSVENLTAWKKHFSESCLVFFKMVRSEVWRRKNNMLNDICQQMSALYRNIGNFFPCHFRFCGKEYTLLEPKAWSTHKASKTKSFLLGTLRSWIADGHMDRLATIVFALSSAGKILPSENSWLEYPVDADQESEWSETDDEDE